MADGPLTVVLFVEDIAQETILRGILEREAQTAGRAIRVRPQSVRGGAPRLMREVERFLRQPSAGIDAVVVGRDGNCIGFAARRQEMLRELPQTHVPLILAVPHPHIERWLLVDTAAFKTVFGRGCPTPPDKCERDVYKRLLRQALTDLGLQPLSDGLEHAEDLISALDLDHVDRVDASLAAFVHDLRRWFGQATAR